MNQRRIRVRGWSTWVVLGCLAAVLAGCGGGDWRGKIQRQLPAMGHRNWIVVADSAYPWQSAEGIETVPTGAGQIEVVKAVLDAVDAADHVRPIAYLDSEMKYVSEKDAPGIDAYRKELDAALKGRTVMRIPHEELIAKLDKDAAVFRILLLKTDMVLPYTTVFVNLDCGYWSAAKEDRLREAIGSAARKAGAK